MYFPYFRKISIEDLYDTLTNYESSDILDLRVYFHTLRNYSWRLIPRSNLLIGKLTFDNFDDFYQFVKFAYVVYPNLCVTLLYQAK